MRFLANDINEFAPLTAPMGPPMIEPTTAPIAALAMLTRPLKKDCVDASIAAESSQPCCSDIASSANILISSVIPPTSTSS